MAGFGQKLRQERESRNFTLAQVAEATRISVRYLEALESDDLASLPGSVFNKGYVRSFAKFIGSDPEALVQAYVAEEEIQEREGRLTRPDVMAGLAKAVERNPRRRRTAEFGSRIPLLALLALVLLALGAWALVRFGFSSDDASPTVATNRAEPAEAEPDPPIAQPTREVPSDPEPVELPAKRDAEASNPPSAPEPVTRTEQQPTPPPEIATATRPAVVPAEKPAERPKEEPQAQPKRTEPRESPAARQAPAPQPTVEREIASAPPTEPAPVEASQVSINDFGVGTGVVNRQLVGQSDRFDPGTRVWFWNRVLGGKKGEKIRHVWMHEGKTISSIELTLGGNHWRTQSRKTLRAPGRWSVEARDEQNRVLARTDFLCDEPS